MMERTLAPEWLDELPAADARAVESRGDLRRLNLLMGHAGIALRRLRSSFCSRPPARVVEFGAGDGTLLLRIAKRLAAQWQNVDLVLVDRQPAIPDQVRAGFERLGWRVRVEQMNAADWLVQMDGACDVLLANLFLHHLNDRELSEILAGAAKRTTLFLALEPRRSRVALGFSRLLGLIGCNEVTRHDAPVSVKAGFAGRELTKLWPAEPGWELREHPAGLFSHSFLARRQSEG